MPIVPEERAASAKKFGISQEKLDAIDSIPVPASQASPGATNVADPLPETNAPEPEIAPARAPSTVNEYDEIAQKDPDLAGGNEYDSLMAQHGQAKKSAVAQSVYLGTGKDPDHMAKVLELSNRVNLPADVVERNFDMVARKEKVAANDYDSLVEKTPALAQWLSDPNNAAVGHDDVAGLTKLETAVQEHGFAYKSLAALNQGITAGAAGIARIPNLAGSIAYYPYNKYQEATGGQQVQYPQSNPVADYLDKQGASYASVTPELGDNVVNELAAGNYERAGRAAGYQVIGQIPQLASVMMSGGSTKVLGSLAGISAADRNKELADQGVAPAQAAPVAVATGAVEAGTESLGTFRFIENMSKALVKKAGKQGALEIFKNMGKVMLSGGATEATEESAGQFANSMMDYATGVDADAIKNMPNKMANAGILGFLTGGAAMGPAVTAQAASRVAQNQQTTLAKELYLSLGGTVAESKVNKRLKPAMKQFVEGVVKDSPVEFIYIAPEAMETYFQSQDESPAKIMNELGVGQMVDEAKDTGQSVKIPLATWIEKFVDTEHYSGLQNDIKFDPSGMSVNERKADNEQTKAEVESADKEAAPLVEDPNKPDESGAAVQKQVEEQLKAIGKDHKEAALIGAFFDRAALADPSKRSPLRLFKDYDLKIGTGASAQETLAAQEHGDEGFNQAVPIEDQLQNLIPVADTITQTTLGINESLSSLEPQALRDQMMKRAQKGIRRGPVQNAHTGWTIDVSSEGLKKSANFANRPEQALGLENIQALIKNATFLRSAPDRGGDANIQHNYLYSPFESGGKRYLAKIDVRESLSGRNKGKQTFYSLHVQELKKPAEARTILSEAAGLPASGGMLNKSDLLAAVNEARETTELFQGEKQDPRGRISFSKDRQFNIDLLKTANKSTFVHETAHFYVEVMNDIVASVERVPVEQRTKEQARFITDQATLLEWAGAKPGEKISNEAHEKIARGFEKYLFEGVAPTEKLRKIFARFRVWLVSVYKLVGPRAELTPEVREVMDRWVATDEEIEAAQLEQNQTPLFTSPKDVGMNEKQAEAYVSAREEARTHAVERLSLTMMADLERAKASWYKKRLSEVRAEVTAETNEQPIYKVIDALESGKTTDGTSLPDGPLRNELLAEAYGFESGEALLKAIQKTQGKDAFIERVATERMKEEFPDLFDSGRLPLEAMKAIHSKMRAKILRMELEHLASNNLPVLKDAIRRVARRVPTEKAVREQAEKIIGKKSIKEIKPYLYQRAEVKAAKEAGIALARGNFDAAFEAKKRELLNHELYLAAVEAQESFEKSLEFFKKFSQTDEKTAKSRDVDLVSAGRAILAQFGIGKADKSAASYLEQVKEYDPETFETVSALVASATERVAPYKELSFDDFTALSDSLKAIWELSKSTREMYIDGKKMDLHEARALVEAEISAIAGDGDAPGYKKAVTKWEKAKMGLLAARAALMRVEAWVEAVGPAARKIIWNPVSEATTKYRLKKGAVLKQYQSLLTEWGKDQKREVIEATEIGYSFKDKTELLMAILHSGNASNLDKLLRGREWGTVDENGDADASNWNALLSRLQRDGTLTKADYDFAQSIWDLMDSLKPDAQKAHKQMLGYYFSEITADEFVTPFGSYRGGYIPAKVDVYTNEDASIRQEREALEKNNNSFQFPTTGRGFTKSRVQKYAAPLSLEMKLLGGHIDGVLRFTNIEPAVKQAARLTQNKDFRKVLAKLDPAVGKELLTPWLQRAAQQKVVMPSDNGIGKFTDFFARYLRKSVAMQIMFGNVTNAMQQFTGIIVANSKVDARFLRNASATYVANVKATTDAMLEASEYMQSVQGRSIYETSQAIDEILTDPNVFQKGQVFAEKHTYFLQTATQNIVNTIVWTGAYEQGIEQGLDERDAVRAADSAVRLTQGTNNPEDISRFETGTATSRLFTQFAGYFNMLANLNQAEFLKISRGIGVQAGAGKLFHVYLSVNMFPAVFSVLMVMAMAGKSLDEDDDDSYLDDLLSVFFGSQFRTATAMVPYAGQFANAALSSFNDKPFDDRVSLSPVVSIVEGMVKTPREVYKAAQGKASSGKRVTKDVLMLLGVVSGLPIAPIGKPSGYLIDVAEGKAQPTGPVDYGRGLISGQSGKN